MMCGVVIIDQSKKVYFEFKNQLYGNDDRAKNKNKVLESTKHFPLQLLAVNKKTVD